ncbi:phage tail spike protein, partial [Bacillus thuringiensis]
SAGCQYKHPFQFYSDVPKIASARIVRKNPVEALLDSSQDNSFVNRWGGELKRDNFDVKMLQNRGMDRGIVIRHKKDLLGYE